LCQAHFYIAFSIYLPRWKTRALVSKGIHIANILLNYFYLGPLIMCFILALGNHPQGANLGYTLAIIGFDLITIFTTISALLLAFKGLDQLVKEHKGLLSLRDFFSDGIFRNIVLSFGSYVGVACIREAVIFFPS
jgi:chitin synthase